MNPRWRTQEALTEKVVLRELKAWLTARGSKREQRRQRTAKSESGNLTGLVSNPEFHKITWNIHINV